jgi:hypothetical protein
VKNSLSVAVGPSIPTNGAVIAKNFEASYTSRPMMLSVVTTDSAAHEKKNAFASSSREEFCVRRVNPSVAPSPLIVTRSSVYHRKSASLCGSQLDRPYSEAASIADSRRSRFSSLSASVLGT